MTSMTVMNDEHTRHAHIFISNTCVVLIDKIRKRQLQKRLWILHPHSSYNIWIVLARNVCLFIIARHEYTLFLLYVCCLSVGSEMVNHCHCHAKYSEALRRKLRTNNFPTHASKISLITQIFLLFVCSHILMEFIALLIHISVRLWEILRWCENIHTIRTHYFLPSTAYIAVAVFCIYTVPG